VFSGTHASDIVWDRRRRLAVSEFLYYCHIHLILLRHCTTTVVSGRNRRELSFQISSLERTSRFDLPLEFSLHINMQHRHVSHVPLVASRARNTSLLITTTSWTRRTISTFRAPYSVESSLSVRRYFTSMSNEQKPSVPRPSASLIVVNARNEILLVHRNPKSSAFAGMHVRSVMHSASMACACLQLRDRCSLEVTSTRIMTAISSIRLSAKRLKRQASYLSHLQATAFLPIKF
jgi:hypothetical protein